jgi:uncharacterized protein YdhG (YjbR/CyaY superfamily)
MPNKRGDSRKNTKEDVEAGLRAVEAYLATVPEPAHTTLQQIRAMIRAAAPQESTEGLGYGIPTFRYKGALVAYAAFKAHCSFFPMNAALIDNFADELKGYRTSKGTLQFPVDAPLPEALVSKMVKARVEQNEATDSLKTSAAEPNAHAPSEHAK